MNYDGPKQEWFLYKGPWNEALDSYLCRRLFEREEECKPTLPVDSPHAMICAMEALNKELNAGVIYDDVLQRVEFLRKRYLCFKKLVANVNTNWEASNNCITANDSVWKKIFEEDDFAKAYYTKGDPIWRNLCRLFGYNSIKQEAASPTVILISDSPHAMPARERAPYISISEDEVTSPVMKQPTSRKLSFNDDESSSIGKVKEHEDSSCASSSPHQ